MNEKILDYTLTKMKDTVDKCQCSLTHSKKYELNLENGEISLLRTTIDNYFHVTIINNQKKGSITINKTDQESVDEALKSVLEICENSETDEAYDIAPLVENKTFYYGDKEPDLDKMFYSLNQYVKDIKENYPTINLMDTAISFTITSKHVKNSNGVDLKEEKGVYDFNSLFAAKEKDKSSSFNYSYFFTDKFEKDLINNGSFKRVLDETIKQIHTKGIDGKFTGDVIFTPDCLSNMIYLYVHTYLVDMPLISGTSRLKDKLNELVTSPLFTLHARPRSDEIKSKSFITNDGFEAKDMTIIDKGVLKSYLLTQYGAKKTGLQRANNNGEGIIVEAGDKPLDEIIKSVKRGVYVNRVSGGMPNDNGDISVVLKNSFYIEDGEIKHPLNETMITLNLLEAFKNITDISQERIDFGSGIFPFVKIKDVLISGK